MHMNIYTKHNMAALKRRENGFPSKAWEGSSLGETTLSERVRDMVIMDMIGMRRG